MTDQYTWPIPDPRKELEIQQINFCKVWRITQGVLSKSALQRTKEQAYISYANKFKTIHRVYWHTPQRSPD